MDNNENDTLNLLVPDICVNVDDTPIAFNENRVAENNIDVIDLDDDSSKDNAIGTNSESANASEEFPETTVTSETRSESANVTETFPESVNADQENENPNQVPEAFTLEEAIAHNTLFGKDHQRVQFLKIHCTACNAHLGSAPKDQTNRFIHPLLKVLICKKCFDFYGSGDFEKDEDGSELYCRWCGQGGKVLCCAQCPFVFCQRCVRTNLGKRKLAAIKASDDWLCFVCVPENIMKLRVICRALYNYVQDEIRFAAELLQPERLSKDYSSCCQNKPSPILKRKLSGITENDTKSLNGNNVPIKKKKIKFKILAPMLAAANESGFGLNRTLDWQSEVEDEVVCTPDLSLLMGTEESSFHSPSSSPSPPSPQPGCSEIYPSMPPPPPTYPIVNTEVHNGDDTDVQFIGQATKTYSSTPRYVLGYTVPSKPPLILNTTTKKPINANLIKLKNSPALKIVAKDKPLTTVIHKGNAFASDGRVSTKLVPGLKYDWFDNATKFTANVNQTLTTKLCNLSQEQTKVTTLEELAGLHNNLQEVLSSSINSLMQIRKNLRNEFVNGLKSLKFCKGPNNQIVEDDVIIIDSNTTTVTTNQKSKSIIPPTTILKTKRPVVNLQKPSQVVESPIITIQDDNVEDIAPSDKSKPSNGAEPSEIHETLNLNAVALIKRALYESKFENVVTENLKISSDKIDTNLKQKMLTVRVLLEKNFGEGTPKVKPHKGFVAMNVDNDSTAIECNGTHAKEQPMVNGNSNISCMDGVLSISDEELSRDIQTIDSGIDDGEQSLNNGVISIQN